MAPILFIIAVSGGHWSESVSHQWSVTHRIRVDLDDRLGMVPRKTTGVAVMGGFVGLLASVVVHGVGGSLSPLTIVATRLGSLHDAWAMNMLQNYTNKALAE